MASKSQVRSDAGNHSFMQRQTDPGGTFLQHAAQILFMERFLLPHIPLCLLFCVTTRITPLLLRDCMLCLHNIHQCAALVPVSGWYRALQQIPLQQLLMPTYGFLKLLSQQLHLLKYRFVPRYMDEQSRHGLFRVLKSSAEFSVQSTSGCWLPVFKTMFLTRAMLKLHGEGRQESQRKGGN